MEQFSGRISNGGQLHSCSLCISSKMHGSLPLLPRKKNVAHILLPISISLDTRCPNLMLVQQQCYVQRYLRRIFKTSSNGAILFLGAFHFFTPREGQRCAACHIALSEGKPWLHMYVHTKHTREEWSRHGRSAGDRRSAHTASTLAPASINQRCVHTTTSLRKKQGCITADYKITSSARVGQANQKISCVLCW